MKSGAWIWLAFGLALAGCSAGKTASDTGGDTQTQVDTGVPFGQDDAAREVAIVARINAGEKGDPVNGKTKYDYDCALCHGDDGAGNEVFPSLIEKIPTLTEPQLVHIMMAGFPQDPGGTDMPAYDTYTNQEILDTLEYCEETFNPSR